MRGVGETKTRGEEAKARAVRKRVLSEWRLIAEPRDTSPFLRTTSELVPVLLKRLGVGDRFAEEQIAAVWSEIVGDFISQQARPEKIERKTLVVAVLQPAVLYTLERDLKPKLLRRLQEVLGADVVRAVRFRHG